MPIHASIPQVTFAQARAALEAAFTSRTSIMFIGDPGVGKSALVQQLAAEKKLHLSTLIGSTLDPTDVGGMPVVRVDGRGIDRVPLNLVRRVCDAPGILFLDEIACAPPAVQAAMLRGILERVFGDLELHPQTYVVGATNPPEQSPGGSDLSAPLIGRVALYHLHPSHEEVVSYFEELGEPGSRLRSEAVDFALTARVEAQLLEVAIPENARRGNCPWGAPRSWERALRTRAALPEGSDPSLFRLVTAGSVGQHQAIAYEAIFELRNHLPTTAEILADPAGVKVPEDTRHQIGGIGLVGRVAETDVWAAFVYASRMRAELATAAGKLLMKRPTKDSPAKHKKAGEAARLKILQSVAKVSKTERR